MRRREHPQIELQIAPLIDVCFLLLFFYILTAQPEGPERGILSVLPGSVALEAPLRIPDQQVVRIGEEGRVYLNEQPVDDGSSGALPQLRGQLSRLKQIADSHKDTVLVTLETADTTRHQRLVEVLHACAAAGIAGVTFETTGDAP